MDLLLMTEAKIIIRKIKMVVVKFFDHHFY